MFYGRHKASTVPLHSLRNAHVLCGQFLHSAITLAKSFALQGFLRVLQVMQSHGLYAHRSQAVHMLHLMCVLLMGSYPVLIE